MKKHNGMRPQDIVVLIKIAAKGSQPWLMKDLSYELGISGSEVSESINRSIIAGLISFNKKDLLKLNLLDFLNYGLRYVFPEQAGALVRGIATAHSANPLNKTIISNEPFVWPYAKGEIRGQAIAPLHPNVPAAALKDKIFYAFMTLVDALRVGKIREKELAIKELKKRLLNGE